MNPFRMNPLQNAMNMVRQMKTLQKDPSQMAALLFNQGVIDQTTYQQIQGMNPSQIGEYLMDKGIMNPKQAQALYQNISVFDDIL